MSKLVRDVVLGDDLHRKIADGLVQAYEVAKAAYGPNAGNAMIEYPYGDPLISRDGVTNITKLNVEGGVENMTVRLAKQASSRNNESVGDGTTASVILTYHLYKEGRKLVAAGHNRMTVAKQILAAADSAVEQIDAISLPLKGKLLKHVAITSAGDEAIGEMISNVVGQVGADGGITIEDFSGRGIQDEIVDGFYFRKGLISSYLAKDAANLESRHSDVPILVVDKRLVSQTDVADILDRIMGKFKELVIVGSVDGDALGLIVNLRMKNQLMVSVVDAPYEARALFLEDLATLTGATVITEGFNPVDFTIDMLGFANKVIIDTQSTAIIGSDGSEEDVETRVAELKQQLKDATHPTDIQVIKARLSRLTGKVAIIRVGGSSEVEQGETKLRVQDAVCAAQAALKGGIVPGGGATLAKLDVPFKSAFEQPFTQLADNSGLNPERYLAKLQASPNKWDGFDLRNLTDEPIDLLKAGVLDPTLVLKEVVLNAASVASRLITTQVALPLKNRDEKLD